MCVISLWCSEVEWMNTGLGVMNMRCEQWIRVEDKLPEMKNRGLNVRFSDRVLVTLGKHDGKQREGVVIRSQENFDNAPISFKVTNLNYEK